MKPKWQIFLLFVIFLVALLIVSLIAAALGVVVIAVSVADLSEAIFDFWSLGHLLSGIGIFMFVFTLYFVIKNVVDEPGEPPGLEIPTIKNMFISWLICIIGAVVWEIIENLLFYAVGIKVKYDSWVNIITDILLWGIGGLGAWILTHLMFVSKDTVHAYYIFTAVNIATIIILFISFYYMTFNLSP